jgi:hypothetical protein
MAAAPVVSATSLAGSLDLAVKNASALLAAFVERGIAIEVTHRSKRRLYGLKHLAPLREEAAPPRARPPGVGAAARRAERPCRSSWQNILRPVMPLRPRRTGWLSCRSSGKTSILRILTAGCGRPMRRSVGRRQFSIGSQPRRLLLRLNPTALDLQSLVKEQAAPAKTDAKEEAEKGGPKVSVSDPEARLMRLADGAVAPPGMRIGIGPSDQRKDADWRRGWSRQWPSAVAGCRDDCSAYHGHIPRGYCQKAQ